MTFIYPHPLFPFTFAFNISIPAASIIVIIIVRVLINAFILHRLARHVYLPDISPPYASSLLRS